MVRGYAMKLADWSRGMTPEIIERGTGQAVSSGPETSGYVPSARRNRENEKAPVAVEPISPISLRPHKSIAVFV